MPEVLRIASVTSKRVKREKRERERRDSSKRKTHAAHWSLVIVVWMIIVVFVVACLSFVAFREALAFNNEESRQFRSEKLRVKRIVMHRCKAILCSDCFYKYRDGSSSGQIITAIECW